MSTACLTLVPGRGAGMGISRFLFTTIPPIWSSSRQPYVCQPVLLQLVQVPSWPSGEEVRGSTEVRPRVWPR